MGREKETEDAARAALKERQGAGARYDSPAAPARDLLWARRGTAYFARKLNELHDDALDAPSLLPGWSRRHLIAHVGYNARALSRLVEWVRTGIETPMYPSGAARDAEIALGATLPPRALRHLFQHAEVHLNVEWRDLSDAGWDAAVRAFDAAGITLRDTAWMRAREVWVHAVDLANGGSFRDFPPDLVDALIADVLSRWKARNVTPALTLAPTDRDAGPILSATDGPKISGKAADLARWLTGRGAVRLQCEGGQMPEITPWL